MKIHAVMGFCAESGSSGFFLESTIIAVVLDTLIYKKDDWHQPGIFYDVSIIRVLTNEKINKCSIT